MPLDPQTLDTLLQTGAQAATTIVGQRAASGKKQARQDRIAACGRRPLFNRKKKDAYNKCVSELNNSNTKSTEPMPYYPPTEEDSGSNNMKYVYIVIGILAVVGIGFFIIKKMSNKN